MLRYVASEQLEFNVIASYSDQNDEVTPEVLLGLLDRAKSFALIQTQYPEAVQQILGLKRSLIGLRRVLVNTREVGVQIQRQSGNLISQDLAPFFRDVYDHIIGSLDLVETQRDLLSGTLEVYLSSLANRTNEVMKVLTVLSTIALPSIVISGIYGMNLKGIPYLDSPHAMWIVGCLMIGTTVALLAFLKKFGWF